VPKTLDFDAKLTTSYCVDLWVRDEQIKLSTARVTGRIEAGPMRDEPIACVSFGPSLNDTWAQLKDFKYIMTCSGAHKFLVERGIIPTWHVEVDPRPHKVELIGPPCAETAYLIASACHPKVFDHLDGFNVKLWHIFDNAAESMRVLPPGEWAITGGSSVGLRTLTLARFLGFANWKEFETFAHDERFEQSNMLWVLEWAKGSVELYMTEAILKGTIRDAAAKPFLAAWFGMDDPQGGKTAPALTISKDFLNALGVGGTVAVRGGDDAKTQISAPEAGNPQA
jgi:hypothetical protein